MVDLFRDLPELGVSFRSLLQGLNGFPAQSFAFSFLILDCLGLFPDGDFV
ncbi:25268_t:CDS:1, partial [Gigaspora rosea]